MFNTLLEICVDSFESAINASEGGADRLELCSSLSEGGLSPTPPLLKVIKESVNIPVYCMVRPRGGPMVYSKKEREILLLEAESLIEAGANGLVFGALTPHGDIDIDLSKELLKVANGLPCTFHRAFDLSRDPLRDLEVIISLGFHRILTSGCKSSAILGASLIKKLVDVANDRIIVMAGAGIRADNCANLVKSTGVKEVHSSAKQKKAFSFIGQSEAKMGDGDDDVIFVASSEEVAAMKQNLANLTT